VKANAITTAKAPPISGRRPPRKNAYGRPTSYSSLKWPELMRWTTLTTAPTEPAISAATPPAQSKESTRSDTSEITAATETIPVK
jgi:hypothetical protein